MSLVLVPFSRSVRRGMGVLCNYFLFGHLVFFAVNRHRIFSQNVLASPVCFLSDIYPGPSLTRSSPTQSYPSHSHLMASVLGPVQPAHPSPFRALHNASHPRIPYPHPVSTHSLLSSLHLPTHIRNPNRQRLFPGNLTLFTATSPYRAYAPNSSPTSSPAPSCPRPPLGRQ